MTRAGVFQRLTQERGAYAILFAILIVVLFTMVAIVIDLSDARSEVRANVSRSDFASLAAAKFLSDGDPVAACSAAWDYLVANTPGLASATSPCVSGVDQPFTAVCTSSTPAVNYHALNEDPYEVIFVYPVPDGHPLLEGRTNASDGHQCERFGVSISTDRDVLFGGIVGSTGLDAPATSVARGFHITKTDAPIALLLLDPVGCTALLASGGGSTNGGVQVYPVGNTTGTISVDSNGKGTSCKGGSSTYTTDVSGSGGGTPGRIWSCGPGSDPTLNDSCEPGGKIEILAYAGACVAPACEQVDVDDGKIKPQPTRLKDRRTRAPVDARYNCQDRPPGDEYYVPSTETPATEVPLEPCADPKSVAGRRDADNDGFTSDYIDELKRYVGTNGYPGGDLINWLKYPDSFTGTLPNKPCEVAANETLVLPPGNWWVNCSPFTVKGKATFTGGNVVIQGGLAVNGQLYVNTGLNPSSLDDWCVWNGDDRPEGICPTKSAQSDYDVTTNSGSEGAAFLYLRNGSFVKRGAGGIIRMLGVFTYIHSGVIDLAGGAAEITWIAPYHGTFEDLALWSESSGNHLLTGASEQDIEGVFFTPFANTFEYAGGGAASQTKAQFLTYRMYAHGNGVLKMAPDPDRAIHFPVFDHYLIR